MRKEFHAITVALNLIRVVDVISIAIVMREFEYQTPRLAISHEQQSYNRHKGITIEFSELMAYPEERKSEGEEKEGKLTDGFVLNLIEHSCT